MWRPEEGWNNPNAEYHNAFKGIYSVQDAEYEAYEAGADAILEALKEGYTVSEVYDKDWYINRRGGAWVFIPEEVKTEDADGNVTETTDYS